MTSPATFSPFRDSSPSPQKLGRESLTMVTHSVIKSGKDKDVPNILIPSASSLDCSMLNQSGLDVNSLKQVGLDSSFLKQSCLDSSILKQSGLDSSIFKQHGLDSRSILGSNPLPSNLVPHLNLSPSTSCNACVLHPIIGNIPCSTHIEQMKEAALSRYDLLSSQLQLGLLASGYPVLPISRDFSFAPDNGRKKKKTRTTFSRAQVFGLERKFATQKYLSTHDRILLAAALQMTECQVKIWFQNRRTKWRREKAMMKQGNRGSLLMSCDSDHMIQ